MTGWGKTAGIVLLLLVAACGARQSSRNYPEDLVTLCGNSNIVGIELSRISGPRNGCGIAKPVEIHYVAGISLNEKPILNCSAAKALEKWVRRAAVPSAKPLGERIESLRVVSHYSCRTRNSQPGAKLSEHAKGNAIDIAGLTLSDGTKISVLKDWAAGRYSGFLHTIYRKACGIFGTTLGPGSDGYHKDHMHFDTARYSGRTYCG